MSAQTVGETVAFNVLDDPVRAFRPVLVALLIVVVVAAWLLVARTAFIQAEAEEDMDRPSRVGQLYGYTVCLVAVLIAVFTIGSLINDVVTLVSPGQALESAYGRSSLTSFEAYRATRDRDRLLTPRAEAAAERPDSVPTAELRVQYEALRSDRLTRERADAVRSLISSGVLLAFGIVLFLVHWRWLGQTASRGLAVPGREGPTGV